MDEEKAAKAGTYSHVAGRRGEESSYTGNSEASPRPDKQDGAAHRNARNSNSLSRPSPWKVTGHIKQYYDAGLGFRIWYRGLEYVATLQSYSA